MESLNNNVVISQPIKDYIPFNPYTFSLWYKVKPGFTAENSWGFCQLNTRLNGGGWGNAATINADTVAGEWTLFEYTVETNLRGKVDVGVEITCYGDAMVDILLDDFSVVEECPQMPSCIQENLFENPSFEVGVGCDVRVPWVQHGGSYRGPKNGISGVNSPTYL